MPNQAPDRTPDPAAERQSIRLFVALDIPESVRRAVSELAAQFRTLCGSAKWANLAGAHATLKFIGWTPLDRLEKIQQALSAASTPPPFDLRFAGLGFFPNPHRPRVFWAGMEGGMELPRLAATMEESLVPLGIPKESREFRAHLTLARFGDSPRRDQMDRLVAAVAEYAETDFGSGRIEQFHLYQSVLKRQGAEYTRLSSYPLAEGK